MLWAFYIAMTVVLTLLLASLGWLGIDDEMTPYQALAHAFATMPTGGFSPKADSLQSFSPEAQWIIALFMFLAGMNFVLLYRGLVRRRPRLFARDEELRLYALFVLVASVALLVQIWGYGIAEGEEAVRTAVFQAISIITTTGFATTDFALWPVISLLTLFALMFVGRLCGIDDRVDQGRPPPAPRKGAAPRARSDREPRGGHAHPLQRRPSRRAAPYARSLRSSSCTSGSGRSVPR